MISRRNNFSVHPLILINLFGFIDVFLTESHNHRLKRNESFSEHGKLCNTIWRPNLTEPLQECDLLQNRCTEKEFTCIEGNCCPSKTVVCSMPVDSGHELQPGEHFARYAFDESLNACIKFSYFGNSGNFNNFLAHRDCIRYCFGFRNTTASAK